MLTTILTEAEAAKILNIKPETLRAWRCRKKGPAYLKLESAIRYDLAELQKYLQAACVR